MAVGQRERILGDRFRERRLPECWIPPGYVLDCRALLEAHHDLREEHSAWVQRIHATLYHHGAPSFSGRGTPTGGTLADDIRPLPPST